jgi:hypothetical protein
MKLSENDLQHIFLANIKEKATISGTKCPSPKQLLQFFREKKSEKERTRIIDHVTSCSSCAQEFEFILKAIRYEKDMNKVAQNILEAKKEKVSLQRLSWKFAPLAIGFSVLFIILSLWIIPNRYLNLEYRDSSLSQIGLFSPQKKNVPKSLLFFQWEDVENSEYYTFELYDETLYQIWISNKIFDNSYSIPSELSMRLDTNKSYFWMVTAFFPNGRKIESQLKEILITE